MKKILILSVCVFSFFIAESQTTIDGEIRPRAEYRYGYQKLPDTLDFALFSSQRTRLNFQYKKDKLTTKISIQDVRVWGDETLKKDIATLGLTEGWAEWRLTDSVSIKIGRQYFICDNQRLMSNNNWNQIGQSHDAVLLKIKYRGIDVHFGNAFNNDNEIIYNQTYTTSGNYKTLSYLWLSKSFNSNIKTSGIAISDGLEKSGNYKVIYLRETFGGNIEIKYDPIGANLRAYYQMGKYKGNDVNAFYLNPEFYCKISNLNVLLGAEYLSGQDNYDVEKGKSKAFSTLYGTAHSFNGYLDYFTKFNPDNHDTKGIGLLDNYLKLKYKVNSKSCVEADVHYFTLPNDYHYDTNDSSKVAKPHLGTELDLTYKYDYSKNISLSAGYSAMLGAETLKYLKGGNEKKLASWAYIMITFKPVFYSKD